MIHARVQHHGSRWPLLPGVLRHLAPFSPLVVEHSPPVPDPWGGYQKCLTGLPDCTHLLIVQDDAQPVPGFADAVDRIAARWPDNPVCLWLSASPHNAAGRARRAWGKQLYVPLGPAAFVPLVAVLWPKVKAEEFLDWSQTAARMTRADDGNVARWMKQTKQEFMVTVPSIVEHDDFTPTVKGGRRESKGLDRARVALLLASDAGEYDW